MKVKLQKLLFDIPSTIDHRNAANVRSLLGETDAEVDTKHILNTLVRLAMDRPTHETKDFTDDLDSAMRILGLHLGVLVAAIKQGQPARAVEIKPQPDKSKNLTPRECITWIQANRHRLKNEFVASDIRRGLIEDYGKLNANIGSAINKALEKLEASEDVGRTGEKRKSSHGATCIVWRKNQPVSRTQDPATGQVLAPSET